MALQGRGGLLLGAEHQEQEAKTGHKHTPANLESASHWSQTAHVCWGGVEGKKEHRTCWRCKIIICSPLLCCPNEMPAFLWKNAILGDLRTRYGTKTNCLNHFNPKLIMQILLTIWEENDWVIWEIIVQSTFIWTNYLLPNSPYCMIYLWWETERENWSWSLVGLKELKSCL